MKLTKIFAFVLGALAFAACENKTESGKPTPSPEPGPEPTGGITLVADKTTVKMGESVTFTVVDDAQQDVTAQATIYDKDFNEVASTVTFNESGQYSYFATLGSLNSKYVIITVMAELPEVPADPQPDNYAFNHRVLLIDHTGVNCGYCPVMTDTLLALAETDVHGNYNEVTCHAGSYAGGDPGNSAAANALNQFQSGLFSGYPALVLNFYDGKSVNYNGYADYVRQGVKAAIKTEGAEVGISMAVVGDTDKVYCAAKIKSAKTQEYKATAWLLESNIYSPNQSGAQKDVHKIYNYALRNMSHEYSRSNVQGDSIGVLEAGDVVDCAFELPIVSTKWESENFDVLVIVSALDSNGRWDVVNTAMCHIGETKEIEYL